MKICIIRHSILNRGGDKMILAHAAYLAENGHTVTIMTNEVNTQFKICPKITFIQLPWKRRMGTLLFCLLKKQNASLILADIIPLVFFLAFRNRKRLVYYAQDYDESYYDNSALKFAIRFFYYWSLTFFAIPTIAVSHNLADLLSARFRAEVTAVTNGVDSAIFYPEPSHDILKNKNGRKAILILARHDRRKGFDIAKGVVKKLSSIQTLFLEVWTVGEPATDMAPGLPHRDFGRTDENHLRALLSSADVFLYPSRHEGFPLMVIEAFACRCPVVTTDAVPYAKHEVNALVSQIEDVDSLAQHVVTMLHREDMKGKIVEEAFLFAAAHTLQKSHQLFEQKLVNISAHRDSGKDLPSNA